MKELDLKRTSIWIISILFNIIKSILFGVNDPISPLLFFILTHWIQYSKAWLIGHNISNKKKKRFPAI